MGELEKVEGDPQRRRVRIGVRLLACAILAVSATAIAGSRMGAEPLNGVLPGLAPQLAWAVAFGGLGIALALASFEARAAVRAAQVVAALVAAGGLLGAFLENAGGLGPVSGLGFALLGSAILVAPRSASLSRLLVLLVGASAALVAVGYLYGVPTLNLLPVTRGVLVKALLLLAAGFGILFLRPESGLPAALLDRSEAGRELRRLFPAAVLLPLVLGWLVLAGEKAGWYDGTFETALFAVALALSLFGLASVSYTTLRRSGEERRRARAELAASEARYRRTFEQARVGIAHLAPDGRWLRANERLCEILGYDAAELLEKTYAEVSHLQDLEIDVKQWELLRRGEISDYGVERRFETKGGEIVHADVRLVREEDETGALRHLIVVLQDITGRKLSEGTLRVYERALAATQNGVVITDASQDDHPIAYANPAFLKITGYAQSEVIGRNCRLLNEKARKQAGLDDVRRAIAAGEACSVLLRNHRKDGEAFWNQLSIAPVEDQKGRLTHYVGVIVDATERVQALSEREELLASAQIARQEAESANRAKDRFLSVVSHELRSPLNAILAWTSMLRDESGEDAARMVDAIEASVHSQTRLVNDLLDASRIRTGSLEIEPARIDLDTVVRSAVKRLAPTASERGITLEIAAHGPAFAIADAERIEQVVRNLVDNALNFTPKGGHVAVALSEGDETWRLDVRDDGRGLTAAELPHVFDEFWQGDRKGGSSGGKGLGLGLLIVKHLVERHGGVVRVESEGENRGTSVRVELPKAGRALTEAPAEGASAVAPDLTGVEVVVVDDDVATVDAIGAALSKAGAIPRLAKSVPEALLFLERGTPDVLVSDIGLPDRDGFDLIRAVRGLGEAHRSILAIAVTGLAEPEERRRIRRAGFDSYLSKPVGPDVVIDRIVKLRALEAATTPPTRRVLVLDADPAEADELVLLLRKMGHEAREARDAAEALREASRFEPQLILARASNALDAAALGERLAARGVRADLVGLVDDGAELSQQGFDLTWTKPLDPGALDRLLRFAEET
jgi:PAS domain S-box-containing protein